jgi:hypothetical protein
LSTITAQPLRHNRKITCGAGASFEPAFTTGFAAAFNDFVGFEGRREAVFPGRAVRRLPRRDDRVAAI